MADEILVKYKGDTAELENRLSAVESKLRAVESTGVSSANKVTEGVNKIGAAFDETGKKAVAAMAIDKTGNVLKTIGNVQSLRSQIKAAVEETARLAKEFGVLDPRTKSAANNAAILKNELNNVNKSIAALNPEQRFNSFIQVIQGSTGAMFALQGALTLFGDETDETKEKLRQFQGALNLAQGLNSLLTLPDALKNVKLALGIVSAATSAQIEETVELKDATSQYSASVSSVKTSIDLLDKFKKGDIVITELQTAATVEATVATQSFTAALLTNPIFLTLAAITSLVAAYLLLKDSTDNASNSLESFNNELEFQKDVASSLKRIHDENVKSAENDIKLSKAKGLSDSVVYGQEKKLIEDRITLLEHERDVLVGEGSSQSNVSAKNAEIRHENENLKILQAQFDSDREKKEKELRDKKKKAEQELQYQLRQITIDLTDDTNEKVRLAAFLEFDKQAEAWSQSLDKREISFEEYSKAIGIISDRLNKKLDANKISTIDNRVPSKRTPDQLPQRTYHDFDADIERLNSEAEKRKEIKEALFEDAIKFDEILFNAEESSHQRELNRISERKQQSNDLFEQEAAALEKRNERGAISDREYARQKDALDKKKRDADKKFQEEEKRIKNQQAQAEWQKSIFDTITATASAIMKVAYPPLQIAEAILGATQLAIILSHPPPKFSEGTSSVRLNGNKPGKDTVLAFLDEGERVVSKNKNKKNWEIYEALDNNKFHELVNRKYVVPRIIDFQKEVERRRIIEQSSQLSGAMLSAFSGLDEQQMRKIFSKGVTINNWEDLVNIMSRQQGFQAGKFGRMGS